MALFSFSEDLNNYYKYSQVRSILKPAFLSHLCIGIRYR